MENQASISFEFSPPKEGKQDQFIETIKKYDKLQPQYLSLTYGALGSSNSNSQATLKLMLKNVQTKLKTHLTCGASTVEQVNEFMSFLKTTNIRKVLALRGDIVYEGNHFQYATDLMAYLKKFHPEFELSVAGYPEIHPESVSMDFELAVLKRKIDCGAKRVITQLFFDVDSFLKYRDYLKEKKVNITVEAGLMALENYRIIEKITKMSRINMPPKVQDFLNQAQHHSDEENRKFAFDYLAFQVESLKKNGVLDFHFYTLNRLGVVYQYCQEEMTSE